MLLGGEGERQGDEKDDSTAETKAEAAAEAAAAIVERIYIGGLDPDSLTIPEILDRVPKDAIRIHNVSHPDSNPCYFHLVASVLKSSSATAASAQTTPATPNQKKPQQQQQDAVEGGPALKIVQKLLHNVKWKGCKLQVQAARPHFLERLAAERKAIADTISPATSTAAATATPGSNTNPLKRFIRVRHSYGKPAWVVDTKPYQVEDGKVFGKMVQHVRQRAAAAAAESKAKPVPKASWGGKKPVAMIKAKKPFRAVHWHFRSNEDDDNGGDKDDIGKRGLVTDRALSPTSASSSNSSVASESTSDSDSNTKEATDNVKNGGYVWSDDDESDTKSGDVSLAENDDIIAAATSKRAESSATGKYAWSDDDGSGSDSNNTHDEDSVSARRLRPFTPKDNILDEFAAAIDESEDEQGDGPTSPANELLVDEDTPAAAAAVNFEEDEARNLKVLAALFPDTVGKSSVGNKPASTSANDGWNSSGQIMMRYDPNKASSKQLEQEVPDEDEDEKEDEKDNERNADPMDDSDDDDDDDESLAATNDPALNAEQNQQQDEKVEAEKPDIENVYRQDDLEDVFRQAREAQANQAPVVVEKESAAQQAGGGFSFGFAVQEQEASSPVKESATFSFGFSVPETTKHLHATAAVEEPDNMEQDHDTDDEDPPREHKRRRLHSTSYNDLDAYVNAFIFEINDGPRIASDLEGFRHDPAVQEDWERQRHKLTLDWKSKRKRAVARRQQKRHA